MEKGVSLLTRSELEDNEKLFLGMFKEIVKNYGFDIDDIKSFADIEPIINEELNE